MIELLLLSAVIAGVLLFPKSASAHCDTPEGPVIIDGKKALAENSVDRALKWVNVEAEAELARAFELCVDVRGLSDNARKVADHHFLETLVRLHRASEGAPYSGIKPAGTGSSPVIAAADKSMETGSIDELLPLIEESRRDEVAARFRAAIAKQQYDLSDITAGREYVRAYVHFVKFAAGEDHEDIGEQVESHAHNC